MDHLRFCFRRSLRGIKMELIVMVYITDYFRNAINFLTFFKEKGVKEHFGAASSNNCASLVLYKQAEIFFFTKQLITNDITHTFKFSIPTVRKERDSIESTFRVYKNLFELIRRARKAPSKHACCFFFYTALFLFSVWRTIFF